MFQVQGAVDREQGDDSPPSRVYATDNLVAGEILAIGPPRRIAKGQRESVKSIVG